ncbi:MAG: polysaccharide export protein EpsE [Cytophagales bacterium]|nr:polysaccharide export protein EpsE [Rhizobacter sp.]
MRLLGSTAALISTLLLALPLASHAQTTPNSTASAQYRLATGDVIRITVFQNIDLTLEARVSETGVISYPLLGTVSIGGLTLPQAEKRIADGLRDGNFVKQPQVSILVTQVRGNQVSVLGHVGRPGRFPLEMADTKLTDMLATAGGIGATGSDTVVLIGRRNGQPYRAEFDLPSIFGAAKRGSDDVILQNGDVIWIERAPVIYLYGEVQRPGSLRLERGMSVMQALASVGGITQRGTMRGLRVHRRDADGKVQVIESQLNDPLRPDDVVYVRESVF